MIALVFAHPYPDRSHANRALLASVADLDGVELRSLYDRYPDFDIDVVAEQRALAEAEVVVWQHPMYWYSTPGLLKHWFDKVLERGWAYGDGGTALHGKRCLWVVTTGAEEDGFTEEGVHGHAMELFVPHVKQVARFCGMHWEDPIVVHGALQLDDAQLASEGRRYRERLVSLIGDRRGAAKKGKGVRSSLREIGGQSIGRPKATKKRSGAILPFRPTGGEDE